MDADNNKLENETLREERKEGEEEIEEGTRTEEKSGSDSKNDENIDSTQRKEDEGEIKEEEEEEEEENIKPNKEETQDKKRTPPPIPDNIKAGSKPNQNYQNEQERIEKKDIKKVIPPPPPPITNNNKLTSKDRMTLGAAAGLGIGGMLLNPPVGMLVAATTTGLLIKDALTPTTSPDMRPPIKEVQEGKASEGEEEPKIGQFCEMIENHEIKEAIQKIKQNEMKPIEDDPQGLGLHYAVIARSAECCKLLIQKYGYNPKATRVFKGRTVTPIEIADDTFIRTTCNIFHLLRTKLEPMVGLINVKQHIYALVQRILLDQKRTMMKQQQQKTQPETLKMTVTQRLNLLKNQATSLITSIQQVASTTQPTKKKNFPRQHLVLTGNPGVGKTHMARLMGEIYYELGLTQHSRIFEVQREELVASYIGQTASKTKRAIMRAKDAILFVDEAYRLSQTNYERDYGREAIDEIMQHMSDGNAYNVTFIFAGYPKPMEQFIAMNPGLFRRVHVHLALPDYQPHELAQIVLKKLQYGFESYHPQVELPKLTKIFENCDPRLRLCMNAGLSVRMIEKAIKVLNDTLSLDATDDELTGLTLFHFKEALKRIQPSDSMLQKLQPTVSILPDQPPIPPQTQLSNPTTQNSNSTQIPSQNPTENPTESNANKQSPKKSHEDTNINDTINQALDEIDID